MKPIILSVLRRLDVWASYVAFVLVGAFGWVYYNVLNRTTVEGRGNIPKLGRGVIFCVNHRSMFDSFLVGVAGFFPSFIARPARPPYNLPAKENFGWLWIVLRFLRTKFVRAGRRDPQLLFRLGRILERHNVLIFYQGGRSEDLRQFRANSIPYFVDEGLPNGESIRVVPVYHEGLQRMFGGTPGTKSLRNFLPRHLTSWFARHLTVRFGPPIDFSSVFVLPNREERYEAIKRTIVERVEALHDAPSKT